MKYYQDVTLLRDARIGLYDFWEQLFPQVHLALVENKLGVNLSAVGVAFPEYDADAFLLGSKLRLFAKDAQELERLQLERLLNRMRDYMRISAIQPVPEQVDRYACFKSVKPKGSREKKARRRAKRNGESFEQALAHFDGYQEERSRLPFIHMHSESNGHRFRLFIEQQVKVSPYKGSFSCYGLSRVTTVPIF